MFISRFTIHGFTQAALTWYPVSTQDGLFIAAAQVVDVEHGTDGAGEQVGKVAAVAKVVAVAE